MKLELPRNPLVPRQSAWELIAPGFFYVEDGAPIAWKAWRRTDDGTAINGLLVPFAAAYAFLPSTTIVDRVVRGNAKEVLRAFADGFLTIGKDRVMDLILPTPGGLLGAAVKGGIDASPSAEESGKLLGSMLGDRFALFFPLLDMVEWQIEEVRKSGLLRRNSICKLIIGTDNEGVGRRDSELELEIPADGADWPRLPFIMRFTCEWEAAARMAAEGLLGPDFSLGSLLGSEEVLPRMPAHADLFSQEAEAAPIPPRWSLPSGWAVDDVLAALRVRLIDNGVSEYSALSIAQLWFYWRAIGSGGLLSKPNIPILKALLDDAFRKQFEALVAPTIEAYKTMFPQDLSQEWLQVGFFINALIGAQEGKLAQILGVEE